MQKNNFKTQPCKHFSMGKFLNLIWPKQETALTARSVHTLTVKPNSAQSHLTPASHPPWWAACPAACPHHPWWTPRSSLPSSLGNKISRIFGAKTRWCHLNNSGEECLKHPRWRIGARATPNRHRCNRIFTSMFLRQLVDSWLWRSNKLISRLKLLSSFSNPWTHRIKRFLLGSKVQEKFKLSTNIRCSQQSLSERCADSERPDKTKLKTNFEEEVLHLWYLILLNLQLEPRGSCFLLKLFKTLFVSKTKTYLLL